MKFSDGNWLIPESLEILNPVHVHEVRLEDRAIVAVVATRELKTRGDQLNTGVFTIRLWSPGEGIIAVRLEHFRGGVKRGPDFALTVDPGAGRAVDEGDTVALVSGGLTARLPRAGRYRLDFLRGGQRITGSGFKAAGRSRDRDTGAAHVFERLDLDVGETVHGLGERFTAFVKNGQSVEIWNRDGGTGTDQAYKNIPFFLTSKGWGLFVNSPGRVGFEIATEKVSKAQFSLPGEGMEYMVIDGPDPKGVLTRYTALTGRPALPPRWSFGLWLTTSFTTDYDEGVVQGFVEGMRQRGIPLQVFHYDCFWMRGMHWTDFEWDPGAFPDPEGQLARLRERGLNLCLWINPYISELSGLFEEARAQGYLLTRPDGSVWQWDLWQPGMGIVDFTNPAACAWFKDHLRRLVRMGVDAFKTDFGERIPTDVVWHDGSDPERMHNYYPFLYNKLVFDLLAEEGRDPVLFARSATVGGQMFPVHWGGDCDSNYPSMAESLRGGLSLGLSGFGFWSHDIGGFEGTAPADVYKRWCAFGLLSSHSRLHGSDSYRVPWAFDEEAVEVLRHFTRLKCRLMPYLWQAAQEAAATGVPMMRAMLLEFPDDPGTAALDRQYMLGGSLLVAPVFSAEGRVDLYLPPGRWTHLLTGTEVSGGGWRRESHDVFSLPLYVREGTLLPIGARDDGVDYDYAADVVLELYALAEGAEARVRVDGALPLTVAIRREGGRLTVAASGTGFSLRLIGLTLGAEAAILDHDGRGPRVAGRDGLVLTLA